MPLSDFFVTSDVDGIDNLTNAGIGSGVCSNMEVQFRVSPIGAWSTAGVFGPGGPQEINTGITGGDVDFRARYFDDPLDGPPTSDWSEPLTVNNP